MERAKQIIVLRSSTEKPKRSARARRRGTGKENCLPKRIPRKQLDLEATGGIAPIDSVIVSQLRAAMVGTNDALLNACLERKLLPVPIINAVNTARFLSMVMLAARAAQAITGVPASILLSDAWHSAPGTFLDGLSPGTFLDGLSKVDLENDWFGTGEPFSSVEASFMDHANRLSRNPKFQAVLLAKNDPAGYLKALGACKLWDKDGRFNRVATITGDYLQQCDVLPDELA